MHCLWNMITSQNQNVFSTFLQPKNASFSPLIVGLFTDRNARFPFPFIYTSTSEITISFYIRSNTALHLIITDSLLCLWGKKAFTFSLNSSHLIRTLSMAPSVLGINGVWLYLKPEKDAPVKGEPPGIGHYWEYSPPGYRAVSTHSFTLKLSLKQSGASIDKKEFQERLI